MLSLDQLMPDELELGRLLQDASESPESNLLHAEQHKLLHQAVLRIPVQLRLVRVLHDMEELATQQVAQVLALQPGTVRVRLHRARLWVRKEMSKTLDGTQDSVEESSIGKHSRRHEARAKKRPFECRELFSNLSDYLDSRIEPQSCEKMRNHIEACPACVAFLRDVRGAIDCCRSMQVPCDPAIAPRLRAVLTQEYLRMLGLPISGKVAAAP
jgi:RNA polymerase sigma-70 factor (ECF subfamily)